MKDLKKVNLQFFADEKVEDKTETETTIEDKKEEDKDNKKVVDKEDLEQAYKNKFAEGARKAEQNILSKFGVKSVDELESLIKKEEKPNADLEKMQSELSQLRALQSLNNLNVNKSYQDDVIALIKGKGKEVTEESIKEVLDKHPSWINDSKNENTRVLKLGADGSNDKPELTEEQIARKLLGW